MRFHSVFLASLLISAFLQGSDLATIRKADLLYRTGKWMEAARLYELALSSNHEDAGSARNLANCYKQSGDFAKAIASYQAAAKIQSARVDSLYALASLYALTGDKEHALEALNKAIDEGFDDSRTTLHDKSFDSLRDDPRYLSALRRLLGEGFTGFDRVEPTKDDMRKGIQLLASAIRKRSPDPYRTFSPAEWNTRIQAALSRVDSADATGYFVELVGLAGMVGDVHTAIIPAETSKVLREVYALRFWRFSDGLYIRAAAPGFSYLVGAKVLAIQGVPVDTAWQRLMSKVPTENE